MTYRSNVKQKRCPQCDFIKPAEDFHKGSKRCKKCEDIILDITSPLPSKPVKTIEDERKRHREKYHRLGYKEKQIEWDKDKPWKKLTIYKSLRKKQYKELDRNFELHHWNYNDDYLEDVFVLEIRDHKKLHTYLNLSNKKIFYLDDGTYLDTKEKHQNFIQELNIKIHN